MPLSHPAADVWTLLADVADATPDAPAFIHGERALTFAELLDAARRTRRARRSRRRPGRSRGAVAAQRAGLSHPLFRLRAAGRHRRRGQHALSRRRGRRHRRPLRRQGAGLRAGFRRIDFLSILAEIEPQRSTGSPPSSSSAKNRAGRRIERLRRVPFDRCCRGPLAANHAGPARPATSSRPRARPARPSSCCIARAPSRATPSRWRAASASTAPDTLSLSILPLCGVFGFNQTLATLAAGKPCVLVESYEIDEIARLIAAAPADHPVRQRRHVRRACSSWCRASGRSAR
jgi:fatty-acyl-CoA synthase